MEDVKKKKKTIINPILKQVKAFQLTHEKILND